MTLALPAIQAGIGGLQMLGGLFTRARRPEYDIPSEFRQNINIARGVKTMGMPVAEYNRAAQGIQRNVSTGISTLQGRRGALGGVASLMRAANDAQLNLDSIAARMRLDNFRMGSQMEMGANAAMANQKIQKMNWEKLQPYLQKVQQKQALFGAGMQNIMGGLQSGAEAQAIENIYGNQQNLLKNLFGRK